MVALKFVLISNLTPLHGGFFPSDGHKFKYQR
jgi:hypothetical protein